jgi:chloride channel protein, CIC family
VSVFASRALTDRAMQIGQTYGISVHIQIRVAHSVADTVLEIIQERHIDLLLMGWSGVNSPGFVFGSVVDTLVQRVNCRMMLVKLAAGDRAFERWLVPTAGGPNSRQALRLLPALLGLGVSPEIYLCHVARCSSSDRRSSDADDPAAALNPAIAMLQKRVDVPIEMITVQRSAVAAAIVDLAGQYDCDVIVVGATRSGMLQQVIQGNIPEEIARRCDCTVILVREATM